MPLLAVSFAGATENDGMENAAPYNMDEKGGSGNE